MLGGGSLQTQEDGETEESVDRVVEKVVVTNGQSHAGPYEITEFGSWGGEPWRSYYYPLNEARLIAGSLSLNTTYEENKCSRQITIQLQHRDSPFKETYGFIGWKNDIETYELSIGVAASKAEETELVIAHPESSALYFWWKVNERQFDQFWNSLESANPKIVMFMCSHASLHKDFDPEAMGSGHSGKFLAREQVVEASGHSEVELYRTETLWESPQDDFTNFELFVKEEIATSIPVDPRLSEVRERRLLKSKRKEEEANRQARSLELVARRLALEETLKSQMEPLITTHRQSNTLMGVVIALLCFMIFLILN